jgi:integration host factor subunit beta
MKTITKRDLVGQIADCTKCPRDTVKLVMQAALDAIVEELGKGNRIEFRDFGVFEIKQRRARRAQNPRTKTVQEVGPRRAVRFKAGRLMKQSVASETAEVQTLTKRKIQPSEGVELKLTGRRTTRRTAAAKPAENGALKLTAGN